MIAAFGLAWILEIIAVIFSNNGNQMVFSIVMVITMFMPFMATLIARIPLNKLILYRSKRYRQIPVYGIEKIESYGGKDNVRI